MDRLVEIHKINGTPTVNPPENRGQIRIEFVNQVNGNESTDPQVNLSVPNFEWRDEEAAKLRGEIDAGRVFQCPRHDIEYHYNNTLLRFERLIKLSEALLDRDRLTAPSIPYKGLEQLNENANTLSYWQLFSEGLITDDVILKQPYTLEQEGEYLKKAFLFGQLASLIIHISDAANELTAMGAEGATIFDSVGTVIRAIVRVTFIAFLAATAINTFFKLVDLLIQRVKYLNGMSVNDIFRIPCEYLGWEYIPYFDDDLHVLPPPRRVLPSSDDLDILGIFRPSEIDARGFPRMTFGEVMRRFMRAYFLRVDTTGGVFKLRGANDAPESASVNIPDTDQRAERTNASELLGHINITFLTDERDKNTIDNWEGTNIDVSFTMDENDVTDKDAVIMPAGSLAVQVQFARGSAKEKLNRIEQIFQELGNALENIINALAAPLNVLADVIDLVVNTFLKVLNAIIRLVGGNTIKEPDPLPDIPELRIGDVIDNRVGMLKLSNDDFLHHKLVKVRRSSSPKYNKIIGSPSALELYEEGWRNVNQQKRIIPVKGFNFTLPDAIVSSMELAANYRGAVHRVYSLTFSEESGGLADAELERIEDYVNLIETITIPENG